MNYRPLHPNATRTSGSDIRGRTSELAIFPHTAVCHRYLVWYLVLRQADFGTQVRHPPPAPFVEDIFRSQCPGVKRYVQTREIKQGSEKTTLIDA